MLGRSKGPEARDTEHLLRSIVEELDSCVCVCMWFDVFGYFIFLYHIALYCIVLYVTSHIVYSIVLRRDINSLESQQEDRSFPLFPPIYPH